LLENYGSITPELIYRYVAPLSKTGDTQNAVFDYSKDIVYLQYSHPVTKEVGYKRPILKLSMR